jgi:hypothetical protein
MRRSRPAGNHTARDGFDGHAGTAGGNHGRVHKPWEGFHPHLKELLDFC